MNEPKRRSGRPPIGTLAWRQNPVSGAEQSFARVTLAEVDPRPLADRLDEVTVL